MVEMVEMVATVLRLSGCNYSGAKASQEKAQMVATTSTVSSALGSG